MVLIQISQALLMVFVFLFPLFFTTLTAEYYATSKMALLVFSIPLLLLLWTVKMIKEKRIVFTVSKLNLPVLLFATAVVASTIVASPNKFESLTATGGTAVFLLLVMLYFLVANLVTKKEQVIGPLCAGNTFLALLFIAQFLGILAKIIPVSFLKNDVWTPSGTVLTAAILFAATIPLTVEEGLKNTGKNTLRGILGWTASIILGLGLVFTLFTAFGKGRATILPYDISWTIAVDSLRNIKTAFFGVGPANFLNAFTSGRPLSFNNLPFWGLRFGVSGSFLLQFLTEVGLIGFIVYLLLIANVLKTGRKSLSGGIFVSLIILFLAQTFFPATISVLFLTFILLGLFSQKTQDANIIEHGIILPRVFMVIALLLLIVTYWTGYRWYRAELYYGQSIAFATQNKAVETYNAQYKAIRLNPNDDRLRISASQTDLALAGGIAQKGSLSDQDRQNISSLIQQSIAEAKVATTLNPNKASNWENLAFIYRNLINAAQGADQWAIAAYNQAIKLDPLNPNLRLSLGGVLYSLKNYDGAVQQFTLAVNLKPDWANAHYNLAAALREKGDFQNAFNQMQNTLALVDPNSNDFNKASAELEELRKKLPPVKTTTEGKPETLTEPAGKAVEVKPKIELPAEQAAPEIPATETPTPTEGIKPTETKPTPNL